MISILLSCYKSNFDYLKEQIDSIINQTEKDWELLIHPDNAYGSENDKIKAFVESYKDSRIRIVGSGHYGYAKAYNLLLKEAKGEYVCFCDHDDIWVENKLEIEKGYLDNYKECDCVFSFLHWFGEKNKIEAFKIEDWEISDELLFWQPVKQPSAMFRKASFGEFDAPFDEAADFWFWSKHHKNKYHLIPYVLVHYRRHAGEATKDKTAFRENSAKVIQRNLAMEEYNFTLNTCKLLDRYSKDYDPELKKVVQAVIRRDSDIFD